MQPKSLILLLLALGCGVVAAVGAVQLIADSGDKGGGSGEMEPIYVALEDIDMGTPLSAEVVKLEDWPKGKAPAGALNQLEDVEGRGPRTKIFAGEPILDFKLLTKGEMGDSVENFIPKGYRLVPIKVTEETGGASMILPGTRVDVYLHTKKSDDFKESMVKQILQNVKVIAVGDTWTRTAEGEKTIRAKTVSLVLRPASAMKVTLAAKTGDLSLVLRSPEDDEGGDVEQVGIGELFSGSELANTEEDSNLSLAEDESTRNKKNLLGLLNKSAATKKWTTRVLSGKKLEDLSMEQDGGAVADLDSDQPGSSGFWKITTRSGDSTEESASGAEQTAEDTKPAQMIDGTAVPEGEEPGNRQGTG